ncbi:hypothetical protein GCM10027614_71370 [Micromonospora vulcania]
MPAERFAAPDALVGPGQAIGGRRQVGDVEVVELTYQHDGQTWWQAHWLVPVSNGRTLLVTAQAPTPEWDSTRTAAEAVATSLT